MTQVYPEPATTQAQRLQAVLYNIQDAHAALHGLPQVHFAMARLADAAVALSDEIKRLGGE